MRLTRASLFRPSRLVTSPHSIERVLAAPG
jgi:hypothetical protein